jgi:hypothetical protein
MIGDGEAAREDDAVERTGETEQPPPAPRPRPPRGGLIGRLAEPFGDEASPLERLRASALGSRLGARPNGAGPSGPLLGPRNPVRTASPLLVIGAAFALGMLLAKVVDWRGHAHPR